MNKFNLTKTYLKTWFNEKKENTKNWISDHKYVLIVDGMVITITYVACHHVIKYVSERGYRLGLENKLTNDIKNMVLDSIYNSDSGIIYARYNDEGIKTGRTLFTAKNI